jgi:hypothetical protein
MADSRPTSGRQAKEICEEEKRKLSVGFGGWNGFKEWPVAPPRLRNVAPFTGQHGVLSNLGTMQSSVAEGGMRSFRNKTTGA